MSNPEFVYATFIKTTPEKLWKALTTTEFTRQYWFSSHVESDWQEGSPITFYQADGKTENVRGKILRSNPPRELSYSWAPARDNAADEPPSRVTFNLEKNGDLVKLTVVHDQFTPDSAEIARVSKGWPAVLSSLKSLLESGQPLVFEDWKPCA